MLHYKKTANCLEWWICRLPCLLITPDTHVLKLHIAPNTIILCQFLKIVQKRIPMIRKYGELYYYLKRCKVKQYEVVLSCQVSPTLSQQHGEICLSSVLLAVVEIHVTFSKGKSAIAINISCALTYQWLNNSSSRHLPFCKLLTSHTKIFEQRYCSFVL